MSYSYSISEFPISGTPQPSAICNGPDGRSVWFGASSATTVPVFGRLDTLTKAISLINIGSTAGQDLGGCCVGSDGNMWVANSGNSTLYKVDPTTQTIISNSGPIAALPTGIGGVVSGADGRIYCLSPTDGKLVGMATDYSGQTAYTPPSGTNTGPHGLSIGPDGNGNTVIWFVEANKNQIAYMTTAGVFTEIPMPLQSGISSLFYCAPGDDGNMYFTDRGSGQVGRVEMPSKTISLWMPPSGGSNQPGGTWKSGKGIQFFAENSTSKIAYLANNAPRQWHTSAISGIAQNFAASSSVTASFRTLCPNGGSAKAGDLLVCFTGCKNGVTTFNTPTDNIGTNGGANPWTRQGAQNNVGTLSDAVWIKTAVGGESSFTVTNTGTNINVFVYCIPAALQAGMDGTPTTSSATATTSLTTGAFTPSTGNTLLITHLQGPGTFSGTWTNGWVSDAQQDNHEEVASLVTTATTALSTSESWTNSNNAISLTIGIKLTGAPAALVSPITEQSTPTASALPDKLALGPGDGNVYFTEHNAGKIGEILIAPAFVFDGRRRSRNALVVR